MKNRDIDNTSKYDIKTKKDLQSDISMSLSLLTKEPSLSFNQINDFFAMSNKISKAEEYRKEIIKLYKAGSINIFKADGRYLIYTDQQIKNLEKENPTCNCCNTLMNKANGKYGAFFYCGNKCKEQKTVSEKWWKEIKAMYKKRLQETKKAS